MDWHSYFQPVRLSKKFSYTAHALHGLTLFSADEFSMILDYTLKSEFLYNNLVMCCEN